MCSFLPVVSGAVLLAEERESGFYTWLFVWVGGWVGCKRERERERERETYPIVAVRQHFDVLLEVQGCVFTFVVGPVP